jgi:hypothetical protein
MHKCKDRQIFPWRVHPSGDDSSMKKFDKSAKLLKGSYEYDIMARSFDTNFYVRPLICVLIGIIVYVSFKCGSLNLLKLTPETRCDLAIVESDEISYAVYCEH